MQGIPNYDGRWTWEGFAGVYDPERSYEYTFRAILSQIGAESFQELANQRALELDRNIKVLDLFGGAYFLSNLKSISRIVGVRLTNIDDNIRDQHRGDGDLLEIIDSPKRFILEGNLYKKDTWKKLTTEGEGSFDLIICRPEGPFQNTGFKNIEDIEDGGLQREKIFISLLERTLNLLSLEGGMLFSQIPTLNTNRDITEKFWSEFILKKKKDGYEFFFGKGRSKPLGTFAAKRNE